MSKEVRKMENQIKTNLKMGIMGKSSKTVDYIMYASIVFSLIFGYVAYNKL